MNNTNLKAMISLLDDSDHEVVSSIEAQIVKLGPEIIPKLEKEAMVSTLSPVIQQKLNTYIHQFRIEELYKLLLEWKTDGGIDLLRGLWLIARFENNGLKIESLRSLIKELHMEVWIRTKENMHPKDMLKIINNVIFKEFKFEPNVKNFHAVSNSFINEVFELKKGNPVALSCIYILLAEKLDLPIYGVNLPNLFVLVFDYPAYKFYINPFNKGQVFSAKDIDDYLKQMNIEPEEKFYKPCNNIDIILRILTNLSFAYNKIGENSKQSDINTLIDIFK